MADTIAAIATATGGGIGVVRISGPRARAVLRAVVPSLPAEIEPRRIYHGWAVEPRRRGVASTEGAARGVASTEGAARGVAPTEGAARGAASTEGAVRGAASTEGAARGVASTEGAARGVASTEGAVRGVPSSGDTSVTAGADAALVDEVLCFWMAGPRTFTGEDVAELHGHGGAAVLGALLEATLAAGARLAEPGEFTRRAFVAGRIDLARAEAVAGLVAARSQRAARLVAAQAAGAIGHAVVPLRTRLVEELAELEAAIDFPDERLETRSRRAIVEGLAAVEDRLVELAQTHARGRTILEGLEVALVGRPNAGKSSLLNALVGEERALVDAAAGTTRDVVEAEVDLGGGVTARVVDTAGEREAEAAVEARGIALARRRRARADVVAVVVDGAAGFGAVERALVDEAAERAARVVVVWNKADLAPAPPSIPAADLKLSPTPVIGTVAPTGAGIDLLRAALRADLDGDEAPVTVTSARQRDAFAAAAAAIARARGLVADDAPLELPAVDVRAALARLAEVTGEAASDELLDAIFSRFCIGK